jgi:HEAT repeat protein
LKEAQAASRAYLLELLGKVSGQKALEAVAAGVKSADPATKDAATRVLGEWLGVEAAPVLLEIVKNDADAKYRIRALRGYIRIARQLQLPAETRLAMFRAAMELAKRNEERRLALDILSRIPSAATLELAVSYVGEPALKEPAAESALKIATQLIGQEPKAVAGAMQKLVDANVGGASGSRAKQLLDQAKSGLK